MAAAMPAAAIQAAATRAVVIRAALARGAGRREPAAAARAPEAGVNRPRRQPALRAAAAAARALAARPPSRQAKRAAGPHPRTGTPSSAPPCPEPTKRRAAAESRPD